MHTQGLASDVSTASSAHGSTGKASGQESPSEAQLYDYNKNTVELARMTVVGTRFGINIEKYPGSASVLTPDDLDFTADIIRALANVPGIDMGNDMGRGMGQQYSIRGFGYVNENRVIIMQDGVRRSTNLYSNQSSSFRVDSDLLKQVDIVRGSSGISYGGGAIGGIINMTTKDARDYILPGREVGLFLSARYDSNSLAQGYSAVAVAPASVPLDLLVFVKQSHRGDLKLADKVPLSATVSSDEISNDEDTTTAFVKVGWNIAPGHRLAFSIFKYDEEAETTWQSLYNQQYSTTTGPVFADLVQTDSILRYTANPAGSRWLNLNVTAYRSKGYLDRSYSYVPISGANAGIEQSLNYKNQDKRKGLGAQNLMHFETGPVKHRLLLGADYENRKEDALYVLNAARTDFGSIPNEYNDYGLFLQYEPRFLNERLALQAGGRYDSFKREVKGVPEDYDSSRFSPRIGVSAEILTGLVLLANYSEAFRAPTPHETSSDGPLNIVYWYRPNPDLDPELSAEYEFGFSWGKSALFSANDRFNVKAMYFTGRIKDMIALEEIEGAGTSPAGTPYATYQNIGRVKRDGVEVEMAYRMTQWGVNLSYEHLNQRDAATGKKTPHAFADKIRLGGSVRPFSEDIEFSADVSHWFKPSQNPKQYSNGTYYVRDDYTQCNVSARWRLTRTGISFLDGTTQLHAGINNVFDQKRMHPSNLETGTRIGLGRNIYISASKQF
ncbi:hemoglobin/transferrin/lactoferrin receptor protein [Ereboglobus sp. PH5-5]|uniref:TonB-dependent receptor domain-containing protein n=1 Tax=unclassified Ereboglobus TaxID=2626932 RepID=UPI00240565CF|nr:MULTISPECIES: TonB-dependent receptor [unclassified Ereboglobus]MDF9826018.1 hemoglobin/transferrin/lactoferrin receptor protein [Ereboglobus sp. PH5-10]MDF9833227.1 hemoglobin/transferrin/lactoferrin receptor protein [Ereboglobus sp. PH5-5]